MLGLVAVASLTGCAQSLVDLAPFPCPGTDPCPLGLVCVSGSCVIGGDLGMGDVKLSISLGLLFGLSALFYGLVLASLGFALVLVGLMAVRKLGLKSAVPFGPVLIFAAFLAALAA